MYQRKINGSENKSLCLALNHGIFYLGNLLCNLLKYLGHFLVFVGRNKHLHIEVL